MLDENCPIEEVRELFGNDRFATEACGCRVLEASRGHAVCAFDIAPIHLNAMGNVMGGAIFTLADFALAIACNIGEDPTVAVNNTIEYLNRILNYIIFIGAIGLTIVGILPFIFRGVFGASISFGGTSLIIVVSVVLETIKQIESMMMVRNYKGFLNE